MINIIQLIKCFLSYHRTSGPWLDHLNLDVSNKKILESENDWLDDKLINASQNLLKKQYPQIGGFQNTLFGQNLSFKVERGTFVQIIHSRNHWVCITNTGCNKGEMEVIDSMFDTLPQKAVNQVAAFVHSELPALNLKFLNTQRQCGYSDCGLYAIATATAICEGKDPCTQLFCQEYMCSHLSQCLKMEKMILFPAKERDVSIGSRVRTTQIVKLFCHCRQPSYGNMIQCKKCSDWFHGQCESISTKHWENPYTWNCRGCA